MGTPGPISLARTLHIRSCARSIENTHARNRTRELRRILRKLQDRTKSVLKGTNCLFASKDHVRPGSKRLCIIFMACSCPNIARSFKEEEAQELRRTEMEKIAVFRI